jgi:exopolyphosphatase/guanosine-5'-triphosphate,3'-diphosphate pyrophosphatase
MANRTFAAVDVGSNEITMKIYEIAPKKGAKELDCVISTVELGSDTYNTGKITEHSIVKICEILNKYKKKMKEYGVGDYRACASSAVREAENSLMFLERVKLHTGIDVQVLSNSEQRFMNYKAFVAKKGTLEDATKSNALLDIGAGSLQISIFDKQNLVQTQNLPIGAVRIRDYLATYGADTIALENIMEEYVANFIEEFKYLFINDKDIKSIIAIGDGIAYLKKVGPELDMTDRISREQFRVLYNRVVDTKPEELSERYGVPYERATLMLPLAIIYQSFLDNSRAEDILTPGVTFCDGIVADYMDARGELLIDKDFDEDILASAYSITKKYKVNKKHAQNVMDNALDIFDAFKGAHGLGKRERLQLQIAALLHSCGKFVNMSQGTILSYHILMSTEILGLSHKEREEIANVVRYNIFYLPSQSKASQVLNTADYMKVAKLSAILRLADVLDKSHRQKIEHMKFNLKDSVMTMTTDTLNDITLEAGLFRTKTELFHKVFGVEPVLKQKRGL